MFTKEKKSNNVVILGAAGAGKTFIMKGNIAKALQNDTAENIVLNFDRDYIEFATALSMAGFDVDIVRVRPETPIVSEKSLVVFDMSWMMQDMIPGASEMVLEYIKNRIALNQENGKKTQIYIDDFLPVMGSETFHYIWHSAQEYNASVTIATQNSESACTDKSMKTLLSSADHTIILRQYLAAKEAVIKFFDLSQEEAALLSYRESGTGLLVKGSEKTPFEFKIKRAC